MYGNASAPLDGLLPGTPGYDPKALGARCDECILHQLRDSFPVGPDIGRAARVAVVGEGPGLDEAKKGLPFVGISGQELDSSLRMAGLKRGEAAVLQAFACKLPETAQSQNDLAYVEKQLAKQNKTRIKDGQTPLLHPVEACRPRLLAEVAPYQDVIAVGGKALQGLTGNRTSILSVRGGMLDGWLDDVTMGGSLATRYVAGPEPLTPNGRRIRILPTVHPSFVMRARRWTKVFRADLGRAMRWFTGALAWQEPAITYNPDAATLRAFLSRHDLLAYDVETDGIEPLTANLRCIGIGSSDEVMLVGLLGIDGQARFYTSAEERAVRDVLRDWFIDKSRIKVGHNCLYTGTPVRLGDGTSKPIEQLVRAHYDGEVMALDAHGNMTKARVTGWFRERVPHQEWLVVRRVGEKGHARGLTLTPDHEVYTTRGRVRADELRVGDAILSPERQLEPDEEAALLGSLLSDSTAMTHTTHSNAVAGTKSSVRQLVGTTPTAVIRGNHAVEALVREKNQWLGGLLAVASEVQTTGYIPGAINWTYRTPQMRQPANLAALVYGPDGKRHIGPTILDRLGPVGLAWLFADDGFKHTRPDRRRESVLIATCGFAADEIEATRQWFAKNYGPTTITAEGSVRLGVEATALFCADIAPYLLPAARYKLPKGTWPAFVGYPERKLRPYGVQIESIERFVPLRDTPGHRGEAETRWCLQTTAGNFLTGFGFVKNCGSYDRAVIEQHFGVTPTPIIDTILLHRLVESELPHNLGFVASLYADISPAWKADRTATTAETDHDLHKYCSFDVALNARILPPLVEHVKLRKQEPVYKVDVGVQSACAAMHRNGMFIDQKRREQWEYTLSVRAYEWECRAKEIADIPSLNLMSVQQIRELLYQRWKMPIPDGSNGKPKITKGGDPSTDSEALRTMYLREVLGNQGKPTREAAFIFALRRYRAFKKLLGTYVTKLRPWTMEAEDGFDEDDAAQLAASYGLSVEDFLASGEDEFEILERTAKDRKRQREKKRGLVDPKTGRVYPSYNAHATVVGRIAGSSPNTLNVPGDLRDMFAAADGNVLVGADMDQLHMRIAAARWGIERYLEGFRKGADPHAATAYSVFGAAFKDLPGIPEGHWDGEFFIPAHGDVKWGKPAKGRRDVSKRVCYSGLYKATPETQCRVIRATEEADGTLPYADMDTPKVRLMRDAWLSANPEIEAGWDREVRFYQEHGYGVEPVLGRRRDFLDGENENEIINFPILGAEAGLMGRSTTAVNEEFPAEFAGPGTGLINQNYDSMLLEVPAHMAEHACKRLEALMTQTEATLPGVVFSAGAKAGRTWKDT